MSADDNQPEDDQRRDTRRTSDGDADDDGMPTPFAPDEDDDTPLGDTDQHSDA